MPEQESSKKEAKKKDKKAADSSTASKKSSEKSEKDSSSKASSSKKVLAAIMIRGTVNAGPDVKATLKNLRLHGKNNCVFVDNTPDMKGMLRKVKDFVTWGEVSESVKKDLKDREDNGVYRLHPPRGGFETRGLKKPYKNGGALGQRDNMKELLVKMK